MITRSPSLILDPGRERIGELFELDILPGLVRREINVRPSKSMSRARTGSKVVEAFRKWNSGPASKGSFHHALGLSLDTSRAGAEVLDPSMVVGGEQAEVIGAYRSGRSRGFLLAACVVSRRRLRLLLCHPISPLTAAHPSSFAARPSIPTPRLQSGKARCRQLSRTQEDG